MGATKIPWTDAVWNVTSGCTPISPGCQNCYAERMSKRLAGRCGYPKDEPFAVTVHLERLDELMTWRKPRRVFVCSMGDLFHEKVPNAFLDNVFTVMACRPQHTYLVLTKRPKRMADYITRHVSNYLDPYDLTWTGEYPHVWLGVTAENQAAADERIPLLLQTPAAKRFVSVEPMLGPVDLDTTWLKCAGITHCDRRKGGGGPQSRGEAARCSPPCPARLDWVICGCESGPNRRALSPDWVRALRDECVTANVFFFLKQLPSVDGSKVIKMPVFDGQEWRQWPE